MTGLPAWISAALDSALEGVSRAELRERAAAISNTYRGSGTSQIIRSELDAMAYALVRMPATYAAVRAVLASATELVPDFAPGSVLDLGAGPGTATWAAADLWPSLRGATLIDSNPRMLDLAVRLDSSAGGARIDPALVLDTAARALAAAPTADLVLASYALTEVSAVEAQHVLAELWRLTNRLLVIVEPGTPAGFRRILNYRNTLLADGATIIAPCSHEGVCPLAENPRWCHFSERLPRSRDHLVTKGASVPFEDEKYCYLVAGKGFGDIRRGRRILATPKVSKGGVSLTLCAPEVVEIRLVERARKDDYKAAKRIDWGDVIDPSS